MQYVYVVDKHGKALMPTTRYRHVRKLLKSGKAVAICNKLFGSRDSIQIFSATLTANDVARNWNAEHSNEKPIYMTTRAIEETFGSI